MECRSLNPLLNLDHLCWNHYVYLYSTAHCYLLNLFLYFFSRDQAWIIQSSSPQLDDKAVALRVFYGESAVAKSPLRFLPSTRWQSCFYHRHLWWQEEARIIPRVPFLFQGWNRWPPSTRNRVWGKTHRCWTLYWGCSSGSLSIKNYVLTIFQEGTKQDRKHIGHFWFTPEGLGRYNIVPQRGWAQICFELTVDECCKFIESLS